jgi:hypothetical protein
MSHRESGGSGGDRSQGDSARSSSGYGRSSRDPGSDGSPVDTSARNEFLPRQDPPPTAEMPEGGSDPASGGPTGPGGPGGP